MMSSCCVVPGCLSPSGTPAHLFPKNPVRSRQWQSAVQSPLIQDLTSAQLCKYRVCYRHFTDDSYTGTLQRRRLNSDAIPTLNLPPFQSYDLSGGGAIPNENGHHPPLPFFYNDAKISITPYPNDMHRRMSREVLQPSCLNATNLGQSGRHDSNSDSDIHSMYESTGIKAENVSDFLQVDLTDCDVGIESPTDDASGERSQESDQDEIRIAERKLLPQQTNDNHRNSRPGPSFTAQKPQLAPGEIWGCRTVSRSIDDPNETVGVEVENCVETPNLGGITRIGSLSPHAKKLYNMAKLLQRQNRLASRKIRGYKDLVKEAANSLQSKMCRILLAKLTPIQRKFLEMRLRDTLYVPKDRRYTTREKIFALSLYKQSRSGYRFLSAIFPLPSPGMLMNLLRRVPLDAGLNNTIFENMAEKSLGITDERDKLCILMWDEMELEPHLYYDPFKDKIIGFEDWGDRRTTKFADRALIFMLRSIYTGWKMPLAYHFCEKQSNAAQLTSCIKRIIARAAKAGITVVATVCNHEKVNVATVNGLLFEAVRKRSVNGEKQCPNSFQIDGVKTVPIYDPPSLLKDVRNHLLSNNLEFDVGRNENNTRRFVKWSIIEAAYSLDVKGHALVRSLPKLTDAHAIKSKICKTSVKHASQIFSRHLAAFLDVTSKYEETIPREDALAAAEILMFLDALFDSVNGHTKEMQTPLRVVLSEQSHHHAFWPVAIEKLKLMRWVDSRTKQPAEKSHLMDRWIDTINGLVKIWTVVKSYGFSYLQPRLFNQDPLVHFFSAIKGRARRNAKPSTWQFSVSFKTLLMGDSSSRYRSTDCENICDGNLLFSLRKFEDVAERQDAYVREYEVEETSSPIDQETGVRTDNVYTVNCLLRKLIVANKDSANCADCRRSLFSAAPAPRSNFSAKKPPPKTHFEEAFAQADNILNKYMSSVCFRRKIGLQLKTGLTNELDFRWIQCEIHGNVLREEFLKKMTTFFIRIWCKKINAILSGKQRRISTTNRMFQQAADKLKNTKSGKR